MSDSCQPCVLINIMPRTVCLYRPTEESSNRKLQNEIPGSDRERASWTASAKCSTHLHGMSKPAVRNSSSIVGPDAPNYMPLCNNVKVCDPIVGTSNSTYNFGCWISLGIVSSGLRTWIMKIVTQYFRSGGEIQMLKRSKGHFSFILKRSHRFL